MALFLLVARNYVFRNFLAMDDIMIRKKGGKAPPVAFIKLAESDPEPLAEVSSVRSVFDDTWIFSTTTAGYYADWYI